MKLLIFDIDGTLCDINRPVNSELASVLKQISHVHQVVLASGKPFGYIAGFARQLDIENCIVIGENGGTITYSRNFPPASYYRFCVPNETQELFNIIRNKYTESFNSYSIWFQPNDVNLTVFPVNKSDIDRVHDFAHKFKSKLITVYLHKDSVDFVPNGFDKGSAVDILLEKLGTKGSNLYVFGDGDNDVPMLSKTHNRVVIGCKDIGVSTRTRLDTYKELSQYLKSEFIC